MLRARTSGSAAFVEHSFDAGAGINAISASPEWKHIVVAGRDVMKILSLEKDGTFVEVKNLRRGHKGSQLMMSSNDVEWCHVPGSKNLIATAASTSAVVIWDVEAERKTDRRKALQSHNRAANSVCWHSVPFCLMSASQDGSIHYWDVRVPAHPAIVFNPHSEAVRDIDFNPFYGNYFAAAFDDGTVQVRAALPLCKDFLFPLGVACNEMLLTVPCPCGWFWAVSCESGVQHNYSRHVSFNGTHKHTRTCIHTIHTRTHAHAALH
jgi:WD40 repeat protein